MCRDLGRKGNKSLAEKMRKLLARFRVVREEEKQEVIL
jgi:hypothetical protein